MNPERTIPLEVAMEMSLDDYIAANKQLKAAPEPDSDNYLSLDVVRDNKRPKPVSNQWRFMQQNETERPLGMPPLVSIDLGLDELPNSLTSCWPSTSPNQSVKPSGTVQDIEIQVDNKNYNQAKSKIWRKKNQNWRTNNDDRLRNVEQLQTKNFKNRVSVHQRLYHLGRKGNQQNHPIICGPQNLNFKQKTNIAPTANSLPNGSPSTTVNCSSNFMLNQDFVKNCLEFLHTAHLLNSAVTPTIITEPEKKYDRKLQEEICEIQKKPLMYTGQDFTVVSFDGPGVNLHHKPHTTDMSLNQRFA